MHNYLTGGAAAPCFVGRKMAVISNSKVFFFLLSLHGVDNGEKKDHLPWEQLAALAMLRE